LLLHPYLLSPSPAVNLSPAGVASLLALTQQQGAELIDAAIADAEAQYVAMLLNQQDQRCAAHTAQLTVEGWLNPPSTQSANAAASTAAAQGNTPAAAQTITPDAAENQQHVDSIFSVVPSELQAIRQLTGRGFTLDAVVFPAGISSPIASQCCSDQESFITKNLAGQHIWVCVSFF
jgi:DNA-binding NarL/FixJ family response regulator